MNEQNSNQSANFTTSHRYLPFLLVLFVGSGCAALIYEIVWFQMLELVIGSSAVSLGVLLGTFMGGMCLGSLALPRIISARHHPLRVYAAIELGIGTIGFILLFAIPSVGHLYSEYVGRGLPGILLRGAVCAVFLLPPTLLMGATLPAISRWIETTPRGVSWLGFFYGGNTMGAVFGCLLSGFYLLRVYDVARTTYFAVAINLLVALIGFGLSKLSPGGSPAHYEKVSPAVRASGSWQVYFAIAFSGLSALGAEVIWTRLLSLMIGATVYTFSIILAVFLLGLGFGSSVGAYLARKTEYVRIMFGFCQIILAAAIAWSAFMITRSLPYWPINPYLSTSSWFDFQLDIMRCIWAIFPAACLWGASFPLALASAASRGQDPGRLVGGIYSANTAGAIVGSIGFSMLLIPWVGTQQAQRILICLSAVAALLMIGPLVWHVLSSDSFGIKSKRLPLLAVSAASPAVLVVFAAMLAWSVPTVPPGLVAYGRELVIRSYGASYLYVGEGMNASIAVSELSTGVRNFHVSGKVEASSEPQDMRLERMLGHISALFHHDPRSVLVVGFGAGITAGVFVTYPEIEKIVICEIEPLIPKMASRFFRNENNNVLNDPRVKVIYDDARHYILTTKEKFDIITSDPIHPWVKGSATLYSKEYFELVKQHLNSGGVVTQWVPLYQSTENVVKSEIATFFDVFPNGTAWSNDQNGTGYDMVLVGQTAPMKLNVDELQQRLFSSAYIYVAKSLSDVGFLSSIDLLATYAGQTSDLKPWMKDAEINRDRNLRLQYLAGMGLNVYMETQILGDMLHYRRFPEELFIASDNLLQALKERIKNP